MKWWKLCGAVGLLIGVGSGTSPGDEKDKSRWHRDYATARALARQTNRPMFVVFRCEH